MNHVAHCKKLLQQINEGEAALLSLKAQLNYEVHQMYLKQLHSPEVQDGEILGEILTDG